jgi:hypothetical protein
LVDNTFDIDVDTGVEAPKPTEDPIVSDLVSSFPARDTLPPRYRSNLLLAKDLNNGCYVHQYYAALGIQKEGKHDFLPSFQADMGKRFGYVINGDTYSGLFDYLLGDLELVNMFDLEQRVFAHHQVTSEYSGMQHLISTDPLLYMVVAGKERRYRQLVCLSTMGPIQVDLHTANVTIVKETEPPTEPPAGIVLLLRYIALATTTGIERYRDPSKSSYVSTVYSRCQSVALTGGSWDYSTQHSPYSIGNALNGQEVWDSLGVINELEALFEGDEEEARVLVKHIRRRMVDNYKWGFWKMVRMEIDQFGEESYFYNQQTVDVKRRVIVKVEMEDESRVSLGI